MILFSWILHSFDAHICFPRAVRLRPWVGLKGAGDTATISPCWYEAAGSIFLLSCCLCIYTRETDAIKILSVEFFNGRTKRYGKKNCRFVNRLKLELASNQIYHHSFPGGKSCYSGRYMTIAFVTLFVHLTFLRTLLINRVDACFLKVLGMELYNHCCAPSTVS